MARSSDSPVAPRVTAPDLPEDLAPATPARRADLLAARLEIAGSADLAYASLEQCVVTADADTVDLTGATILDVAMTDMRVASLKLRNSGIRRLRITGGRIGTLDLSGARIAELELRDVRIDYLNLGTARAEDLEVTGCSIRAIDMPQAELTRVRFTSTRSDEVDPRGMRATHVDLRGLDALAYLDANSLRGTTLTEFQVQQLAPTIAAGLGIQIKG
ncbi:pentapeptide repeat-containing protein [Microbacterium sp. LWH12-1.2]|uniref:pentapeptide repeat-containing protein n=1 Tax=Microbacterium sp. LWH12-1.2 TaxID=3135259 RepID=UPI003444B899